MKLLLTSISTVSFILLFSCSADRINPIDTDLISSDCFDGVYLADEVYFPKDTLILNKFKLSDSSTKEKLLVHFRNDSLFLSNYNFGGWYGKWFCNFYNARAVFDKRKVSIDAQYSVYRKLWCQDESPWQKIEYEIIDSTNQSLTLVKTLDTTNCISRSTYRNVMTHLGRGGRDFTDERGEETRSDIQLR